MHGVATHAGRCHARAGSLRSTRASHSPHCARHTPHGVGAGEHWPARSPCKILAPPPAHPLLLVMGLFRGFSPGGPPVLPPGACCRMCPLRPAQLSHRCPTVVVLYFAVCPCRAMCLVCLVCSRRYVWKRPPSCWRRARYPFPPPTPLYRPDAIELPFISSFII